MILLIFKGCIKFKREYYIALAGPPVALLKGILSTTGRERNPGKGLSLRLLTCKPGSSRVGLSHTDNRGFYQACDVGEDSIPQPRRLNSIAWVHLLPALSQKGGNHTGQKKREVLSQTPEKPGAPGRSREHVCMCLPHRHYRQCVVIAKTCSCGTPPKQAVYTGDSHSEHGFL